MFRVLNFNWFLLLTGTVYGKSLFHIFSKDDFQPNVTDHFLNHPAHANISEYPFMAKLQMSLGKFSYECCGVLVDYGWVLTAAHCIEDEGVRVKKTKICMGQTFIRSMTSCNEQREAAEYIVQKKTDADIAMLRLDSNFPADNPNIKPLVPKSHKKDDVSGTTCTGLGWGNMQEDIRSPYLLKTDLYWRRPCLSKMFCMETARNGLCKGDSGGPLICNGILAGIAVTSNNAKCTMHRTIVEYVPVYKHYNFIMSTINEEPQGHDLRINFIAIIALVACMLIVI